MAGEQGSTTAGITLTMQQWNGSHWNHREFQMHFTRDTAASLLVPFQLSDTVVGHAGVAFQVRPPTPALFTSAALLHIPLDCRRITFVPLPGGAARLQRLRRARGGGRGGGGGEGTQESCGGHGSAAGAHVVRGRCQA